MDGAATSAYGQSAQPEAQTAQDAAPEASANVPSDFQDFIDLVESAANWEQVKDAMKSFYRSETFKGMADSRQNKGRANTAQISMERRDEGLLTGLPDQASDITFFRVWIEAQFDKDAITGTFQLLQREAQWASANEATRKSIGEAVAARLESV